MKNRIAFTLLSVCALAYINVYSQAPCKPPEIVFNKSSYNIFSEQQEMELGEVMAEHIGKDYYIITDEQANSLVREIGAKLIKNLPPTNIRFQFFVVDRDEVNAFNAPGGRIYITRRLISFLRNEDELAGVLAHELGHGTVRHGAADISARFKTILGVEKVGDRKDITEKYNQYINKWRTKRVKVSDDHSNNQQLEADRVGLFAMVAAGYDPKAYASAFDRLVETKGKTGGFFVGGNPNQKRLKEMLAAIADVSTACGGQRAAVSNEAYEKWQSYVVTPATFQREEKLKALVSKGFLNPYLREDIDHLAFSPDGNFILAQDESTISLIRTDTFKYVSRVEAPRASFARFTPDSKGIVFQIGGTKIEKWSVETRKPVYVREVYKRGDCSETALSPDGRYLVCISTTGYQTAQMNIFDVETNESIFKKPELHVLGIGDMRLIQLNQRLRGSQPRYFEIQFSPNGRYVLLARANRFSRQIDPKTGKKFSSMRPLPLNQKDAVAFDLQEKKEVKLADNLRDMVNMPFAFYDNDTILGQSIENLDKAGLVKFPTGERVEKFLVNGNSFTVSENTPDHILVRPAGDNPVGVYDIRKKKFIMANKTPAMAVHGDLFVSEDKTGELSLYKWEKQTDEMRSVAVMNLPKSPMGTITAVTVSSDLNWLALSEHTRGGVWNLKTGERPILIRGFHGSFINDDGGIYADFPAYEEEKRTIGLMDPVKNYLERLEPIEDRSLEQYGKFLVGMKNSKAREGNGRELSGTAKVGDPSRLFLLNMLGFTIVGGTLETYDIRTRKLLWSREFPDEVPKYVFDAENQTTVLYWGVKTKAAKKEIEGKPKLEQQLKDLGDKDGDYLIQVADSNTGKVIGETLIETGEGSFTIENIFVNGDWLTIIDSENRVLLYSLAEGTEKWHFFGDNAAIDPAKSIAAIENIPGQVSIYSLVTGEKIETLFFLSPVNYLTFGAEGKRMFVLTRNQDHYLFDTEKFGNQGPGAK